MDVLDNQAAIAAAGGIAALVALLHRNDSPDVVAQAALALGALAGDHPDNQAAIAAAGGIAALVAQLDPNNSPDVLVSVVGALGALVSDHPDNQAAIAAAGGIAALVAQLDPNNSPDVLLSVVGALGELASDHPDNQAAIAAAGGIAALVAQLDPNNSPDVLVSVVDALGALASDHPDNQAAIAAAGGIAPLVAQLDPNNSPDLVAQAALALGALARNHPDNQAAIAAAGGIAALVAQLDPDNSPDVVAQAARALGALARNHPDNQAAIAAAGGIAPLVAQLDPNNSPDVLGQVAAAMLALVEDNTTNQVTLQRLGAISIVVKALQLSHTGDFMAAMLGLVGTLARDHAGSKARLLRDGGIEVLLSVMQNHGQGNHQLDAAYALMELVRPKPFLWHEAAPVPLAVWHLWSSSSLQTSAAWYLWANCTQPSCMTVDIVASRSCSPTRQVNAFRMDAHESQPSTNTTTTTMQQHPTVFLCHAGEQKSEFVSWLSWYLEHQGFSTFLDVKDLITGQEADTTIRAAINNAKVVVLVISMEVVGKEYPMKELNWVLERRNQHKAVPVFYGSNISRTVCKGMKAVLPSYQKQVAICSVVPLVLNALAYVVGALLKFFIWLLQLNRRERQDESKGAANHSSMEVMNVLRKRACGNDDRLARWVTDLDTMARLGNLDASDPFSGIRHDKDLAEKIAEQVRVKLRWPPLSVPSIFVGTGQADDLVQQIVDGGQRVLHGEGGIGKTALATMVYNRLADTFPSNKAFVILGDSQNSKEWTQTLLKQLGCSEETQIGAIHAPLCNRRVLLFFDNVGCRTLVQQVLKPFLSGISQTSVVLCTTKDERLLEGVINESYRVQPLSDDDSKQLLRWHTSGCAAPLATEKIIADDNKVTSSHEAKNGDNGALNHKAALTNNVKSTSLEENDSNAAKIQRFEGRLVQRCAGVPLALELAGTYLHKQLQGEDVDQAEVWKTALSDVECGGQELKTRLLTLTLGTFDDDTKKMFMDVACFLHGEPLHKALAAWEGLYGNRTRGMWLQLATSSLCKLAADGCIQMHSLVRHFGQMEANKACKAEDNPGLNVKWLWDTVGGLTEGQTSNETTMMMDLGRGKQFPTTRALHFAQTDLTSLPEASLRCMTDLRFLSLIGVGAWPESWAKDPVPCSLLWLTCMKAVLIPYFIPLDQYWNAMRVLNLKCQEMDKLPDAICNLVKLQVLDLQYCRNLCSLPESLGRLTCMKRFLLNGCEALKCLPDSIGCLSQLCVLDLHECGCLIELPRSISHLQQLQHFDLHSCTLLHSVPEGIDSLGSLQTLDCSMCPTIFNFRVGDKGFPALRSLHLVGCSSLRTICIGRNALPCLGTFNILGCVKLDTLAVGKNSLAALPCLTLYGNKDLQVLHFDQGALGQLHQLDLSWCMKLTSLPDEVGELPQLSTLTLQGCIRLAHLPASLHVLPELEVLQAVGCASLASVTVSGATISPPAFRKPSLRLLDLSFCMALKYLKLGGDCGLANVSVIDLSWCPVLENIVVGEAGCPKLEKLLLCGCKKIERLPDGLDGVLDSEGCDTMNDAPAPTDC